MTELERVLVVGGGIGGLSTSIALRRAGFTVDVVEKNPKWDVYGVGMIQPANALRVLHEIGAEVDEPGLHLATPPVRQQSGGVLRRAEPADARGGPGALLPLETRQGPLVQGVRQRLPRPDGERTARTCRKSG